MSDEFKETPFAQRGEKIERLGRLMQNPESTINELIEAGWDAGLRLSFGVMASGVPVRDPKKDEDEGE